MDSETLGVPGVLDALAAAKAAMVESHLPPEQLIALIQGATVRKRGRKVPELPEFTFPTSGYTVKVRRIGPWTLDQIRQGLRKLRVEPPIPVLDVEDGEYPNGQPRYRKEANPADPDYKQALKDYEEWLGEAAGFRLLDVIVSSCVVVDPEDMDPEEIAAQRRALVMAGPQDNELGEAHRQFVAAMSDGEVFVRCVCLQSADDVARLQEYVTSRSMPTPAQIAEQVDSFQPEIPREADLRVSNSEIGISV